MSSKIGPGVVCFIVPPPDEDYGPLRNAVCTVVRAFVEGETLCGMQFYCSPPGAKAWVIRVREALIFGNGCLPRQRFTEFPVYESWLRPISGPDIDTSETATDPVHSLISEEAGA